MKATLFFIKKNNKYISDATKEAKNLLEIGIRCPKKVAYGSSIFIDMPCKNIRF